MALQGDGKNMWEWLIGKPALQWDDRMGSSRLKAWGGGHLLRVRGLRGKEQGCCLTKAAVPRGWSAGGTFTGAQRLGHGGLVLIKS